MILRKSLPCNNNKIIKTITKSLGRRSWRDLGASNILRLEVLPNKSTDYMNIKIHISLKNNTYLSIICLFFFNNSHM